MREVTTIITPRSLLHKLNRNVFITENIDVDKLISLGLLETLKIVSVNSRPHFHRSELRRNRHLLLKNPGSAAENHLSNHREVCKSNTESILIGFFSHSNIKMFSRT